MSVVNPGLFHLDSVRPLVRYVDQDQAIIELVLRLRLAGPLADAAPPAHAQVQVLIEARHRDGFADEHRQTVRLDGLQGTATMQLVHPDRWWPVGMGEQSLYELAVSLLIDGQAADTHTVTLGLTSVRPVAKAGGLEFLVNGQVRVIHRVVPIDRVDERRLLPVGADALLLVRDHYGTQVLYDAADRAGLLLMQCVPIDPQGQPERQFAEQVGRLALHPSLIGWAVGHLGRLAPRLAGELRRLDPVHSLYRASDDPMRVRPYKWTGSGAAA